MIKNSILDTIGNTPLVRLSRLEKALNLDGELYAKIEYYSPGLSKKDRIAKYMIEKAIRENGDKLTEEDKAKLNAEMVKNIRKDRENEKISYDKLAAKYGVSKGTIADIINRRTWKDV